MRQADHTKRNAGAGDLKTSQQIIDQFFSIYHPAQAAEYFREISAVLSTPGMSITEYEELEYRQFFERMNEFIQANYQQQT